MMKRAIRPEGYTERCQVIRLDPTVKQAVALSKAVGVSRFVYNWALQEWTSQYESGGRPTAFKLKKQFNALKRDLFPWMWDSPKDANQQPFLDLGVGFTNWFESLKGTRGGLKMGRPTFHKKGSKDSFYVSNTTFSVKGTVVKLPVIGNVRMAEELRFKGRILSGRVSRRAGHWYLSIAVEVDCRIPNVPIRESIGVDIGLKPAVITSERLFLEAPKPLTKALKQLKRANRKLHRRVKGSKNRKKAQMELARLHEKIANIRKDFWHKTTTQLCRENQTVVVEDLKLAFMLKNKRLARAASDVGLGRFRPMLTYKAQSFGAEVVLADRFFPSTQRCSDCGHIKVGDKKLQLGDQEYICRECGSCMDRNLNASLNLKQYPGLQGNWGPLEGPETPMEILPILDWPSIKQAGSSKLEPNRERNASHLGRQPSNIRLGTNQAI